MNLDLCRRIAVRSPLRGSLSLEELSLSLAVARDPCPLEFFQALRLTKISILHFTLLWPQGNDHKLKDAPDFSLPLTNNSNNAGI